MKVIGIVIIGALPLLGLSALAGELEAEEEIVLQEGRIELSTSFTAPTGTKGYARTCEHLPDGTFSADVVSDPVLAEEWRIDENQPTYEWSGIDGTPKGKDRSQYIVRVGAFGTHYTVTATATWKLVCKDGRKSETSASASMTLDAIRYVFGTEAPGVDGRGENELVDSSPGWLDVEATGCTRPKLLTLLPVSSPLPPEGVSPQNEVNNTWMTLVTFGDPLRWRIPCPYWYGGSPTNDPPACCYTNVAKYSISLNPDGCGLHTNVVSVYLPNTDLDSRMDALPRLVRTATFTVLRQENLTTNEVSFIRTWFKVTDYGMPAVGAVVNATSQYAEKIKKEEQVHMRQFMREKGYGFEDMYSIADALRYVKVDSGSQYFDARNQKEVENKIESIENSIVDEKNISEMYWSYNRGYSEREAKRIAGYREAYLYYCTYEAFHGKGEKTLKSNIKVSTYGETYEK